MCGNLDLQIPLVSVIVVNYNGQRFIERCIEAIMQSSYRNVEVVVIDNGSRDGSPKLIEKLLQIYEPRSIKYMRLLQNYGPNVARNLGIRYTRGELCLFVDHDAIVDKDAIRAMVSFMIRNKDVGAVQSKLILVQKPDIVDTCGSYLTLFGFVCEPDSGKESSIVDCKPKPILGGRGCFMIRRAILEQVGLFNESIFLGWDETELFLRIWLSGYKVVSLPTATALHARSSKPGINVEGLFNGYRVFIRCLEFKNLIITSTMYSIAIAYLVMKQMVSDRNLLKKLYNETKRFLSDFRRLLVERKVIQLSVRRSRDADYMRYVRVKLTLSEMKYRFKRTFAYV